MIVRSRFASSAMSNGRSGMKTAWTSQRAAEFSSHSANSRLLHPLVVRERGGRGQPAAVAAHDLVDDQHPRVGRVLGDDVAGVERALLGGGPGAERLADRDDVVVDRLGQPDDGQLVAVAAQVGREVGGGAVGVVAADGVQDVDAVAAQLLGGDVQRVLALLDEAALHAVLDVGELDPAVADRAAAERVQPVRRWRAPRRSPRPNRPVSRPA